MFIGSNPFEYTNPFNQKIDSKMDQNHNIASLNDKDDELIVLSSSNLVKQGIVTVLNLFSYEYTSFYSIHWPQFKTAH